MDREKVDTFKYVREMNELLKGDGLFLVSEGKDGKRNAMTIGWGFLGSGLQRSRWQMGLSSLLS